MYDKINNKLSFEMYDKINNKLSFKIKARKLE